MLLGIAIGILAWQVVTAIVFIFTNEDEETAAMIGMVIPWAILRGLFLLIRRIAVQYYRKNYSLCTLYGTSDDGREFDHVTGVAIKTKDIGKYYQKGEGRFFIKVYKTCKDLKKGVLHNRIDKIRKNGYVCQRWVDENFKK